MNISQVVELETVGIRMSRSMLKFENLGKELLRVRDEYFFSDSDSVFADRIGLSMEGFRKIVSDDESYRTKRTQRSTIVGIANGLNMEYDIEKRKDGLYITFSPKATQVTNNKDEYLEVDESLSERYIEPRLEESEEFIETISNYVSGLTETEKIAFFKLLLDKVLRDSTRGIQNESKNNPDNRNRLSDKKHS